MTGAWPESQTTMESRVNAGHPCAGLPENITRTQAARAAAVSDYTISDWIKQGRLPAWRVGKRYVIRRDDLAALLNPVEPN